MNRSRLGFVGSAILLVVLIISTCAGVYAPSARVLSSGSLCDLNGDGVINILDTSIVASAFGSSSGQLRWNPIADMDSNGVINIIDLVTVSRDFGKKSLSQVRAVWTDKSDYAPFETVKICGSGFTSNMCYDVPVIRPDGSIVRGDGSFIRGWDVIQADALGNFAYSYKLDGIAGLYKVLVYDSPWSGSLTQTPLAKTTFFDATVNLDQMKNGPSTDPVSPGEWVNGNLNAQQSHYIEGYSIAYRARLTNLPTGTSIILTIGYGIKHGDRNALDYLTNYNRINDSAHLTVFGHAPETINPLAGVTGVSGRVTTYTIPAPSSVGSPVPGQPTTSYNNLVAHEGPDSVKMTLFGGTITGISYWTQGDLAASNSETYINVTFSVDNPTAVLAWGGHIASRIDWGYFPDGTPRSAGGISGSPYHMDMIYITEGNVGQQDRSLGADAAYTPPGTIIVQKITVGGVDTFWFDGAGSKIPTSFDYFSLATIAPGVITSETFSNVDAGTYTVTEQALTGWDLANITIVDPDSESTYTSPTATIDLDPNEIVTVTFTNIRHGNITVDKSGPTTAHVGDVVPYTVTLTLANDSSAVTITSVNDTLLGPLSVAGAVKVGGDTDNVLELGETWTWTANRKVLPTDPDPLVNTVTVYGTDSVGDAVSDSDDHTLDVDFNPTLNIVKNGPSSAAVGSDVTYTITLTLGPDYSPVTITSILDSQLGYLAHNDAVKTGGDTDRVLEAGETWTWTVNRTVYTIDPNLLVNTVTVSGTDRDGDNITASDDHTINVAFNPSLNVAKIGPSYARVGDVVPYTVVLTLGPDYSPVTITSVVDTLLGPLSVTGAVKIGGDTDNVLEAGETWTWTFTHTVSASDPVSLYNKITISGTDGDGDTISGSADHTVNVIFASALVLSKSGPATAHVNDTVSYQITLTLAGDLSPVNITSVVDDMFGSLNLTSAVKAGGDLDDVLEAGETWTWTVTRTVLASDPNLLINTVTVQGIDRVGKSVVGVATHTLDVAFNPTLNIVKSGPSSAAVGSNVTYTVVLTLGPDYSPVTFTSMIDTLLGRLSWYDAVKTGGDTDRVLEAGETWTWTVTRVVLSIDPPYLVNTVTVSGTDGDGDTITATDDHTVDVVFNPTLNIAKNGPSSAAVGNIVSYTIVLTLGPDYSAVTITSVNDTLLGPLSVAGAVKVGGDTDNILELGETWTWTVNRTILVSDPNYLVNTVTMYGADGDGDTVTATDDHTLDVDFRPTLVVNKSGPTAARVGDVVTYTVVLSPGPDYSPVTINSVNDTLLGPLSLINGIGGLVKSGGDTDNVLESGETWTWTVARTILPTDPNYLYNAVIVRSTDIDGDIITASDDHTVNVAFSPTLVVKKSGPTAAQVGDVVSYTIALTLGPDYSPVTITSVSDTLVDPLGLTTAVKTGGDADNILESGETWTWTVNRTVLSTDPNSLANTVTVHGTDGDGDAITASASHIVNLPARPSTIRNFVWKDLNRDGIQGLGEPSLSGVRVKLYGGLGNFVATTTTDGTGHCSFTVDPGSYYLEFIPPSGYTLTAQDRGADDTKDSDPNSNTHRTAIFTVTSDQTDDTRDAGIHSTDPPVGGEWVPVDKFSLTAPLVGMGSLTALIAAPFIIVQRKRKQMK